MAEDKPARTGDPTAEQWGVEVDQNRCQGSGTCESLAARYLALDPVTHRASVRQQVISADDAILDAARSCPMEAIVVTAKESGKLLYPED